MYQESLKSPLLHFWESILEKYFEIQKKNLAHKDIHHRMFITEK